MAALTQSEWNSLRYDFPHLVRGTTLKTGDATRDYNCIGFALGIRPWTWVDPPPRLSDYARLFENAGWTVCPASQGQVDGWALNGAMTHGSRYTTTWESKCGRNIRISHVRGQLSGPLYGDIVVSFRWPAHLTAETTTSTVTAEHDFATPTAVEIVGDAEAVYVAKIDSVLKPLKASFSLADEFEVKFDAWKATWFAPPMMNKQSSSDRAAGKEWDTLLAMTARILPQVVSKLYDPSNVFAVQLYNKLQTDSRSTVQPSDVTEYYYLNAQAKRIISLYGSVVATFDEQVAAWKAHQIRVQNSSISRDYIQHPSYDAIVAMGKDNVVPLIMARYAEDPDGWWHEALHEAVHGRKSGANEFDSPKLYRQWKEWYEAPGAAQAA